MDFPQSRSANTSGGTEKITCSSLSLVNFEFANADWVHMYSKAWHSYIEILKAVSYRKHKILIWCTTSFLFVMSNYNDKNWPICCIDNLTIRTNKTSFTPLLKSNFKDRKRKKDKKIKNLF